jgi:hypothetical protein
MSAKSLRERGRVHTPCVPLFLQLESGKDSADHPNEAESLIIVLLLRSHSEKGGSKERERRILQKDERVSLTYVSGKRTRRHCSRELGQFKGTQQRAVQPIKSW